MTSGTCTGTGGSGGAGFGLSLVKFNSINQSSACYGSSNSDVYRYWSQTTSLMRGGEYKLEIAGQKGSGATWVYLGAWIDYNQDSAFDASELIGAIGFGTHGNSYVFNSRLISCNARLGKTRMRVRSQSVNFVAGNMSCNVPSGFGETWDFDVTITAASATAGFTMSDTAYVKTIVKMVNASQSYYMKNAWDVNNDASVESKNTNHNFAWSSIGTKCVKLTVDNCGYKDSIVKCVVIINPPGKPKADFYVCNRFHEQYESLKIMNNSTNGAWKWEWNVYDSTGDIYSLANGDVQDDPFGIGNNRFSENPEFTIDYPGEYTVVLKATNDSGVSVMTKKSYVFLKYPEIYSISKYAGYKKLTSNGGFLYDDGGPDNPYARNLGIKVSSYIRIQPQANLPITLKFSQIRLKDAYDTIKVFDGDSVKSSALLSTYTSADNGTYPEIAGSGKMLLYFSSDSSGVDSGFKAIYYAEGHDPQTEGFEIRHNVLKIGKPAMFYNRYNNIPIDHYFKEWSIDGVVQADFENSDTLKHVFSDTGHQVSLRFYTCDTSFTITKTAEFNKGIAGLVYHDLIDNCLRDVDEPLLRQVRVKLYDSTNTMIASTYTKGDGSYEFLPGPGLYKVLVENSDSRYSIKCLYPGFDSVVRLSFSNPLVDQVNFGLSCKSKFDVGVKSVILLGSTRPGKEHVIQVKGGDLAKGLGMDCFNGVAGQVQVTVNGKVSFQRIYPNSFTPIISGNTFTYTVKDFSNFDTERNFKLIFKMDSTAKSKDSVYVDVRVTPSIGDADTSNNAFHFVYTTATSYDPNFKEVYPVDVYKGYNDWFTYTIHFQNTGNAPALDVTLLDTLDSRLDLETFELVDYSHENSTSIHENVLRFRFDNIMLPDSFTSYDSSQGFVQYRVKPKSNLPLGTKISNTAFIYFDYNEPVVTNTTVNEYIANKYIRIPDPAFVIFLNNRYPACMNGDLMDTTCTAIRSETKLDVKGLGIKDLFGLQFFYSLVELNCSNNELNSLPRLSKILAILDCSSNKFTSLPALPITLWTLDCRDNMLIGLPALPAALENLYCQYNQLTVLPVLPNSLINIWCFNNLLTSLPGLPTSLVHLNCANNPITYLPPLPAKLRILECDSNSLALLPALPQLITLNCGNNHLNALPVLPNSLLTLYCDSNQLSVIGQTLPASLKKLDCSHNQIGVMPFLHNTISTLVCDDNQLKMLPALPVALRIFTCSDNQIACFPTFIKEITEIDISGNPFTCLPNHISAMDVTTKAYPICVKGDTVNNPLGCDSAGLTEIKTIGLSQLKLYPNPGSGVFNLEIANQIDGEALLVDVYNMMGDLVYHSAIQGTSAQVDISQQPNGIYFVRLRGENVMLNTYLVKQ